MDEIIVGGEGSTSFFSYMFSLNSNEKNDLIILNDMLDNIKHEFHFIVDDNVQHAIDIFVNDHDADMLIMLPKKHSFFASLFHKSQSKEMAYHSHIPLLALHQD